MSNRGHTSDSIHALNEAVSAVFWSDRERISARQLSPVIDELKKRISRFRDQQTSKEEQRATYGALLLAQTPRAVLAQREMDKHKHGYHDREKRLYELIDFNDAFVSYVLATRHAELPGLTAQIRQDMAATCQRFHTPMFSDIQFDAIVRGLALEIAVFRGASHQGFKVHMTNRTEDAFGIDMVITDPERNATINIDCKTPAAFRHRLEDLLHHGRITEQQLLKADEDQYITITQHRGHDSIPVTIFCVRPDTLGEVVDFTFENGTEALGDLLRKAMR